MITRRRTFSMCCVIAIVLLFLSSSVLAGDIIEPYPLDFLSLVNYHVVDSNLNGQILSRSMSLEVRNKSPYLLSNVTASLDGLPENITSNDTVADLGNIGPGSTVISSDMFHMTVDLSKQSTSDVKLIWRVECDINGERFIDETSVIEKFQ